MSIIDTIAKERVYDDGTLHIDVEVEEFVTTAHDATPNRFVKIAVRVDRTGDELLLSLEELRGIARDAERIAREHGCATV